MIRLLAGTALVAGLAGFLLATCYLRLIQAGERLRFGDELDEMARNDPHRP